MATRRDYREWVRLRLELPTPLKDWLLAGSLGIDRANVAPLPGEQPDNAQEPTNYMLDSVIASACNTITRRCRVQDAFRWTDIPVPAQSANGLYQLDISGLPGFAPRGVVRVRRSYWSNDGNTNWTPVYPVSLSQQDSYAGNYLNSGPGTPYQIAIEGQQLYLIPGPDTAGVLRTVIGSGALAPLSDNEGYDGVPSVYDDAINYVAIVELGAVMSSNVEMQKRAASFSPFAAEGIAELTAWFDNTALDEFDPTVTWSSQVVRTATRN